MTILSKAAILGAADLQTEDVPVPEWGGAVRVAVMSGAARDRFMELQGDGKTPYSLFQARVLVSCVVDEAGDLLFAPEDVESLRKRSKVALDRVVDVAMRLNKLVPEAVEDEAKNSDAAPSGDSGSASASTLVSP
ncbi:hypothetical protein [Cupriavidus taiwanensis]|uniref:Tail assembly chaperone n=1 Tax=Cupriavidus taiwanensis TaxID=164546 RepID=A0A375IZN1_9BURK|nr:hypothetical protein [Cupriavidus taiwanensis]SPR97350.1 conserved hypothetical protein [Cupriavidus taiwanensis]